MKFLLLLSTLTIFLSQSTAQAATQKVFFISPKNHDKVKQTFTVVFGLSGMKISPAGKIEPDTGHHHLIVDDAPVQKGQAIINDATHLHFGKGQTETTLKLAKGVHRLTLQFANGAHISYGRKMSATISITVE